MITKLNPKLVSPLLETYVSESDALITKLEELIGPSTKEVSFDAIRKAFPELRKGVANIRKEQRRLFNMK